MKDASLPVGRYKVFVNKTTKMFGSLYEEEICDSTSPTLFGVETTMDLLRKIASPVSEVFRLKNPSQLENYSLVEVEILPV